MSRLLTAVTSGIYSKALATHLAARLGESEKGVSRALAGIVPAVLEGLVEKAGSAEEQFVSEISQQAYGLVNGMFGTVTGMLGMLGSGEAADSDMSRGELLLTTLFGACTDTLAQQIANYAGIKPQSARQLQRLAAAAIPALLGQYARSNNLSASGLSAELFEMKGSLRSMLPQRLRAVSGLMAEGHKSPNKPQQGWPIGRATAAVRRRVSTSVVVLARWYSAVIAVLMLLSLYVAGQSRLLSTNLESTNIHIRTGKISFGTTGSGIAEPLTLFWGAAGDVVK